MDLPYQRKDSGARVGRRVCCSSDHSLDPAVGSLMWSGVKDRLFPQCLKMGTRAGRHDPLLFPCLLHHKLSTLDLSPCDDPPIGLCSYYSVNLSTADPQITLFHCNDEKKNSVPGWGHCLCGVYTVSSCLCGSAWVSSWYLVSSYIPKM